MFNGTCSRSNVIITSYVCFDVMNGSFEVGILCALICSVGNDQVFYAPEWNSGLSSSLKNYEFWCGRFGQYR